MILESGWRPGMLVRLSWPKDVPLPAFQRPAGATVESTSHSSVTFLTSDTAGVISKPNGFDVQAHRRTTLAQRTHVHSYDCSQNHRAGPRTCARGLVARVRPLPASLSTAAAVPASFGSGI